MPCEGFACFRKADFAPAEGWGGEGCGLARWDWVWVWIGADWDVEGVVGGCFADEAVAALGVREARGPGGGAACA